MKDNFMLPWSLTGSGKYPANGVRRGVSSDTDEQEGSSSQSTVTQTNKDKDEMEEVVDEKENVEDVGEGEGTLLRTVREASCRDRRSPSDVAEFFFWLLSSDQFS